jgi:RNA polymerase sigma-70 factor (ECF subfamily)
VSGIIRLTNPIFAGGVTGAPDGEVPLVGMTDGALVRRTLDGDARAFTELVDRHAAACLRFATRMLGDRADAEDVAQETFLRAYNALESYDDGLPFRTWLFSILINRCRTAMSQRIRRERRIVADSEALERTSLVAGAPQDSIELREELNRAIAALSPEQREAFLLRHIEELSYEEIMAVTGAGQSALKMRVKRACERLRELLTEGVRS